MAQAARLINGIHTELLVQTHADRVLILVTQLGKVGSLIQASIPATTPLLPGVGSSALSSPPPSIQLIPLLGQPPSDHMQTLYNLYASQIATIVWTSSEREGLLRRPVVVGIALKSIRNLTNDQQEDSESLLTDDEKDLFRQVMDMLIELLK